MPRRILAGTICSLLVLMLAPTMLVAQSHLRTAHTKGSPVITPAEPHSSALKTIFSNLGPSATNEYNDTFGYYVLGPTNTIGFSEQWIAVPFTPKANSTVTELQAAIGWEAGTKKMNLGLYSDNAGVLGTLLASAEAHAFPNFGTCCHLVTVTITATAVTAGTQYWIGATSDDTNAPNFQAVWESSNSSNIGGDVALAGWFTFSGGVPAAAALGTIP